MYSLNHTLLLDSNQCKRIESTVEIVQAVPLNSPVLLAFINIQRIRGSRGTNARRPAGNLINVPRLRSKVARAHTCARPTFKISLFISTISILPILRPPPPPTTQIPLLPKTSFWREINTFDPEPRSPTRRQGCSRSRAPIKWYKPDKILRRT